MLSGRCAVVARVLRDFRVDRLVATSPDSIRILGAAGLHEQSWNRRQGDERSRDFRYAAALPKSLTPSGTRRRLVSTRRIRWASGPEEAHMQFANTITIARRPAEVFAYLAHFESVPLWNYAISDTRKASSGPVGVGSRYRQTRTLPTRSEETFGVTEFEPDRRLSIRGSLGPFHGDVTYQLAPAGSGTALTNTMNLQPSGPLRLLAPLAASRVKSAVATNLGTLKQILETGGQPADR